MKSSVKSKRFKFKQKSVHNDGRKFEERGFYSRNGKSKRKKKAKKTHR